MEIIEMQQRQAFGESLLKYGIENEKIVALDADVGTTTKVSLFGDKFPERFFQAGIAEANMISMAVGCATTGKIPVASAFSYFLATRVTDQIRSACYAKQNIKLVGTHGGLSATVDGASHHAIADIAHMRCLPNMTVLCPGDPQETDQAVKAMLEMDGPVYLRLSRNECRTVLPEEKFTIGKAKILSEGKDITLVTTGIMIERSIKAADALREKGYEVGLIHIPTIKPIDEEAIAFAAQNTSAMMTIEEHNIIGGLGSAVAEIISNEKNCKFYRAGIQDVYTRSGGYEELLSYFGLSVEAIVKSAESLVK